MENTEYNKTLEEQGYKIESKLLRDHEWNTDHMADWHVILTGPNGKTMETEYHTGKGQRVMLPLLKKRIPQRPSFDDWQNSKAKNPELADVLYSLVMDSDAAEQTFDDWCANFGYDTDSRSALATYLLCQENTVKLRGIGAKLYELQEFFQDY